MDTSDFADVCVDTTGAAAAEAARLVQESCRYWLGLDGNFIGDLETSGDAKTAGRGRSGDRGCPGPGSRRNRKPQNRHR
jgi:hypothetical protein